MGPLNSDNSRFVLHVWDWPSIHGHEMECSVAIVRKQTFWNQSIIARVHVEPNDGYIFDIIWCDCVFHGLRPVAASFGRIPFNWIGVFLVIPFSLRRCCWIPILWMVKNPKRACACWLVVCWWFFLLYADLLYPFLLVERLAVLPMYVLLNSSTFFRYHQLPKMNALVLRVFCDELTQNLPSRLSL